jgi:phosphoenolpyruvate carboxykinase (ATP)
MSTTNVLNPQKVSSFLAIIRTVFCGNNVRKVGLSECYELARKQPGAIETCHPIFRAKEMGLPEDAKVLVVNDGAILGRTARARVMSTQMEENHAKYEAVLREAVYDMGSKPLIHTTVYMGLDPVFMIRSHFLTTERHAMNALNVCLNFQHETEEIKAIYAQSTPLGEETDVYMISDPDWRHPDYPVGLVIIDPAHNCVAVLGLRYFGEMKKNLLTFGWTIGVRRGMVACHAGIKEFHLQEKETSMAVFGLSGSGKSSLTNSAFHEGAIDTEAGEKVIVIHDDAFNIDLINNKSIVLEPNLFDKTDGTVAYSEDINYWMSGMNQMVTEDANGSKVIIPSDVRNRNGRAIKSREWLLNLADTGPVPDFVCYLMKDTTLPPISFISDTRLAVAMGASLATMRTSAENVPESEMNRLVFEPFANPFRVYSLLLDCERFEALYRRGAIAVILNTNKFYGRDGKDVDIPKELSLPLVVHMVRGKMQMEDWPIFPGLTVPTRHSLDFLDPDYDEKYRPSVDLGYYKLLQQRTQQRVDFLADLLKRSQIQQRFVDAVRKAIIHMDEIILEMEI